MNRYCAVNFSKIDSSLKSVVNDKAIFYQIENSPNVHHLPGPVFYLKDAYSPENHLLFLDFNSLYYAKDFPNSKTLVIGEGWPNMNGLSYLDIKDILSDVDIACTSQQNIQLLKLIWDKDARFIRDQI